MKVNSIQCHPQLFGVLDAPRNISTQSGNYARPESIPPRLNFPIEENLAGKWQLSGKVLYDVVENEQCSPGQLSAVNNLDGTKSSRVGLHLFSARVRVAVGWGWYWRSVRMLRLWHNLFKLPANCRRGSWHRCLKMEWKRFALLMPLVRECESREWACFSL